MLERLKRAAPVIVGALLSGLAWMERAEDVAVEADTQELLPSIDPACLQVIPDERPVLTLRDAFRVEVAYSRPEPEDELGALPAPEVPVEPVVPEDPGFVLEIQSVVAFGNGEGQARINGYTVKVGAIIPGADPDDPPVLLALIGTSALVRYQGQHLLLDVDRIPRLHVGGPIADQEGAAPEVPSGEPP